MKRFAISMASVSSGLATPSVLSSHRIVTIDIRHAEFEYAETECDGMVQQSNVEDTPCLSHHPQNVVSAVIESGIILFSTKQHRLYVIHLSRATMETGSLRSHGFLHGCLVISSKPGLEALDGMRDAAMSECG